MLQSTLFLILIALKYDRAYIIPQKLKCRSKLIHYSDKDDIFGAEFNEINYNQCKLTERNQNYRLNELFNIIFN